MSAPDIVGSLELPATRQLVRTGCAPAVTHSPGKFHLTGLGLIRAFTALHFWHGT